MRFVSNRDAIRKCLRHVNWWRQSWRHVTMTSYSWRHTHNLQSRRIPKLGSGSVIRVDACAISLRFQSMHWANGPTQSSLSSLPQHRLESGDCRQRGVEDTLARLCSVTSLALFDCRAPPRPSVWIPRAVAPPTERLWDCGHYDRRVPTMHLQCTALLVTATRAMRGPPSKPSRTSNMYDVTTITGTNVVMHGRRRESEVRGGQNGGNIGLQLQ